MRFVRFSLLLVVFLFVLAACSEPENAKPDDVANEGYSGTTTSLNPNTLDRSAERSGLSGARGSRKYYSFDVPQGATNLRIAIADGSGDADLYVRYNAVPNGRQFDCRPYKTNSDETCFGASPRAGRYIILVRGYTEFRGVLLTASYDDPAAPDPEPEPTPDPEPAPNPDPTPDPAPPTGSFNIEFVYGPNVSAAQRQLFEDAGERWEEVIVGDLPDAAINKSANRCGQGEPALNGTVDDVVIYANVGPRDGRGGILASAGPCIVRRGGLTTYGIMNFDEADSNGPELFETILHEMGHVLGIGTLWTNFGLTDYDRGCSASPRYTGNGARQVWNTLGGSGGVPVEDGGGGGTRCGHWDEETFNTELMTGYSEGSASEQLSRLTAASLQDMGYQVNLERTDPYSLPNCSPNCNSIAGQGSEIGEELLFPIGTTDEDGQVILLDTPTE